MLPLAALFAAVVSTACATGPGSRRPRRVDGPQRGDARRPRPPPPATRATGAAIDTDKDQLISAAEMSAYLEASRKATKP